MLLRVPQPAADALQHARRHDGDDGARVVRHEQHERVDDGRHRQAAQVREPDGERIHAGRERARVASIFRGVVGMIIAPTRMTTVFHDSWPGVVDRRRFAPSC